ncbi:hypothetical protein ABZV91_17845 [Nocardia sp. NPDC004568]|uniref:hypothetical protein n=1 Tax=Nocardia sp. NPDC004568 TaxID=3154551 RepID=UPI0033AA5ACB
MVLVLGTVLCLAAAFAVTLPADLGLLTGALRSLYPERTAGSLCDGIVVLAVLEFGHTLWAVTWWRRRRARLRGAEAGFRFGATARVPGSRG